MSNKKQFKKYTFTVEGQTEKWCLNQLTLENVKSAITRSKKIMENNIKNGYVEKQVHGFRYYSENPSLTLWQSVEQILSDCKLL